jgi:hypothetical protein
MNLLSPLSYHCKLIVVQRWRIASSKQKTCRISVVLKFSSVVNKFLRWRQPTKTILPIRVKKSIQLTGHAVSTAYLHFFDISWNNETICSEEEVSSFESNEFSVR